jgi:triphosphoribosyl-dephospho-CoA synthetase
MQESVGSALEEVKSEVSKTKPNVDKINRKLQSARNISEGAAGSLAASGIVHLLLTLF